MSFPPFGDTTINDGGVVPGNEPIDNVTMTFVAQNAVFSSLPGAAGQVLLAIGSVAALLIASGLALHRRRKEATTE